MSPLVGEHGRHPLLHAGCRAGAWAGRDGVGDLAVPVDELLAAQARRVLLLPGQFPPVHRVLHRLGHQLRPARRQGSRFAAGRQEREHGGEQRHAPQIRMTDADLVNLLLALADPVVLLVLGNPAGGRGVAQQLREHRS